MCVGRPGTVGGRGNDEQHVGLPAGRVRRSGAGLGGALQEPTEFGGALAII